jgi:hypothetical protein
MELPTSCTLSKHEKKVFWVLKKCESTIRLLDERLRLISFPDLKVAFGVKSHDYHVLLTQMIAVGI